MLVQFSPIPSVLFSLATLLRVPCQPQHSIPATQLLNSCRLLRKSIVSGTSRVLLSLIFLAFSLSPKLHFCLFNLNRLWSLLLQYNRGHGSIKQTYFPPFFLQTYSFNLICPYLLFKLSCSLESHLKVLKFPIPGQNSKPNKLASLGVGPSHWYFKSSSVNSNNQSSCGPLL